MIPFKFKMEEGLQVLCRRCQHLILGCKNPGPHVAVSVKCCELAPDICGSSVWNILFCYPSYTQNFVVALGFFLKGFCTPDIDLSSLYYCTADVHSLALSGLYRHIHETREVSV
jgi:hypothetical protein